MKEKQNSKIILFQRVRKLQKKLKEKKLDAFIVSSKSNRYYLTGWQGDEESGFLLITPTEKILITDSRYTEHATNISDFSVIETNEGIGAVLQDLVKENSLKIIGFESHDIPVLTLEKFKEFLPKTKLLPTPYLTEDLRKIKDETEIQAIKNASSIVDKAFTHIKSFIKVRMSEVEVSWEMERYMRSIGAQRMAWDPFIVATGKNTSMAHYGAGNTRIKKGDLVQLDYGCDFGGYSTDMSRVLFMGKPTKKQEEVYGLVLEAQEYGLSLVRGGAEASEIDKKVHKFMEDKLPFWLKPEYVYKHSLGHGVGIDVHELPYVSFMREDKLKEGNVITIEPGIYVPGWGGVRIENTVLVTKTGYKSLTNSSKKISDVTILS